MKRIVCVFLVFIFVFALVSCNHTPDNKTSDIYEKYDFTLQKNENGIIEFKDENKNKTAVLEITCLEGSENAYSLKGTTLTFSSFKVDSVYSISGEFYGNIVIQNTADLKFELELNGATIISSREAPIRAGEIDTFTLSAKKESNNNIYDIRVGEDAYDSAIYSECDTDIEGKGNLYIFSENFLGIHTKDDLKIKNLSLEIDSFDTSLKGNDSLTVESGELTLVSRSGHGLKTKNTNVSSKGKQRGIITISGGIINIVSAKDGIDASFDTVIDEANCVVNMSEYKEK